MNTTAERTEPIIAAELDIAEQIKRLMKDNGQSMYRLAKATGKTRQSIGSLLAKKDGAMRYSSVWSILDELGYRLYIAKKNDS